MKVISNVLVVGDLVVATLSDGSEIPLAMERRGSDVFYKIRKANKIVPVGTPTSGVMFSDLTRWTYK